MTDTKTSGKLKVLDLFSGIGGFSLGLERTAGFETIAFCEIDPYCQKILAKHWPDVPIFDDVRTLDYGGPVDLICGGYPCQPFSEAGQRKGEEDVRHLWPAMFSLVKKHRPTWVIGENVAGHISLGLDNVLADLASEDYSTRTFNIPAYGVGAHHKRHRVWIVGHAECSNEGWETDTGKSAQPRETSQGMEQRRDQRGTQNMADTNSPRQPSSPQKGNTKGNGPVNGGKDICNATGKGLPVRSEKSVGKSRSIEELERPIGDRAVWEPEPRVGRVVNGVPGRVDRIRTLGNAVVPQIPEMIGNAILEAEGIEIL